MDEKDKFDGTEKIEEEEEKQTKLGDRNAQAMISFECPECGGFFEYKII